MNSIYVLQLFLYFIIYSVFGWILESVTKSITEKKFINSGFLYGPLCPIYGAGAIIMLLGLTNFKNNVILLFLISFVILSVWEYIVGWLLEKIFNTKYWDYSKCKCNIKGRICLKNSVFWGILGVIFILFVHSSIEKLVLPLSSNTIMWIDSILFIILIIDTVISVRKVLSINKGLEKVKEIGESIIEKLEELKELKDLPVEILNNAKENAGEKIKNIEKLVDELKERQEDIKIRMDKKVDKLKKAFPTLKSEKISQFIENRKGSKTKEK